MSFNSSIRTITGPISAKAILFRLHGKTLLYIRLQIFQFHIAIMAPPNQLGKRVKLTQIRRPFIVGSTARPFSDTNPRPAGIPDNHTHSWEVFVKGLDDTDITYWLRRVQFKLHESIPNYVRSRYPWPFE